MNYDKTKLAIIISRTRLACQKDTENLSIDMNNHSVLFRKYNKSYLYKFLKKLIKCQSRLNVTISLDLHLGRNDLYERAFGRDDYYEACIYVHVKEDSHFSFPITITGTTNFEIYSKQINSIITEINKFNVEFELESHGIKINQ